MITEDLQVELGDFSWEVLQHPHFSTIVNLFETATCQQILATKPDHVKTREAIYATFQGAVAFIDFLKNQVREKDKILNDRAIREADDDLLEDAHFEEE